MSASTSASTSSSSSSSSTSSTSSESEDDVALSDSPPPKATEGRPALKQAVYTPAVKPAPPPTNSTAVKLPYVPAVYGQQQQKGPVTSEKGGVVTAAGAATSRPAPALASTAPIASVPARPLVKARPTPSLVVPDHLAGSEPHIVIVLKNRRPTTEHDLAAQQADIVHVLAVWEEDYEGINQRTGLVGYIPIAETSYLSGDVVTLPRRPGAEAANSPTPERLEGNKALVMAIVDYEPYSSIELAFKEGDVLTIESKKGGWRWYGANTRTGSSGWYPSNLVQELGSGSVGEQLSPTTPPNTSTPSEGVGRRPSLRDGTTSTPTTTATTATTATTSTATTITTTTGGSGARTAPSYNSEQPNRNQRRLASAPNHEPHGQQNISSSPSPSPSQSDQPSSSLSGAPATGGQGQGGDPQRPTLAEVHERRLAERRQHLDEQRMFLRDEIRTAVRSLEPLQRNVDETTFSNIGYYWWSKENYVVVQRNDVSTTLHFFDKDHRLLADFTPQSGYIIKDAERCVGVFGEGLSQIFYTCVFTNNERKPIHFAIRENVSSFKDYGLPGFTVV